MELESFSFLSKLTPEEKYLQNSRLIRANYNWLEGSHRNMVYLLQFEEESFFDGPKKAIFKPTKGEVKIHSSVRTGSYAAREVATYQLDKILGLQLVPTTMFYRLGKEDGVIQAFVPKRAMAAKRYSENQIQKMAVLDYLMANLDRHIGNWRTFEDDSPAAIDNSASFPVNSSECIISPFVTNTLNRRLNTRLLNQVAEFDLRAFKRVLKELEIPSTAIQGFEKRLQEIRVNKKITGEAWGGDIVHQNPAWF